MSDLIWHIHTHTIPAALSLLPAQMTSREARAMLLAIGLQESRFQHRRQQGNGPARGFWQFEKLGGVQEILTNKTTAVVALPIASTFLYPTTPAACHAAIEHHDVLAAVFARLLLWVDPRALPTPIEADKGWAIYLANWRPGKPRPAAWPANFAQAWRMVKGD